MASETTDETVGDEVDWLVDGAGRYVFVEDGVTFVLAKDGYAYAEADLGNRAVELAPDEQPSDDLPESSDSVDEDTAEPAASTERMTLGQALRAAEEKAVASRGSRGRLGSRRGRRAEAGDAAENMVLDEDLDETVVLPAVVAAAPAASPIATMEDPVRVKARAGRAEKAPITDDTPVLLRLTDLKSGYGALPVLHGVSVEVRKGETAVLLGLNGAGKTTTALNVCGALRAWSGTIEFDGQDITDWNTRRCVSAGVVMVPEGRRVFPDLSVAKNLQMGSWSQRRDRDWLEEGIEQVFEYFPRMRERADQLAGTLSGGEQQMLAVGRGLMARPKLLIIDEASMGLAPVIVQDVFDIVSQINRDGVTVLLIEQNVGALDVADLGLVMEQGRMVKQLRGARLKDRREVTEVLMG